MQKLILGAVFVLLFSLSAMAQQAEKFGADITETGALQPTEFIKQYSVEILGLKKIKKVEAEF